MGLVDYLGKMIELTDAELEKIMKCPNLKYRTLSGYIVKGSDVRLNGPPPVRCLNQHQVCFPRSIPCCKGLACNNNQCQPNLKDSNVKDPKVCQIDPETSFISCINSCDTNDCVIKLPSTFNAPNYVQKGTPKKISIRSSSSSSTEKSKLILDGSKGTLILNLIALDISGVDIIIKNNAQLKISGATDSASGLTITNGSIECHDNQYITPIYSVGDINLIDVSMSAYKNSLHITSDKTYIIKTNNDLKFSGGSYEFSYNYNINSIIQANNIYVSNPQAQTYLIFTGNNTDDELILLNGDSTVCKASNAKCNYFSTTDSCDPLHLKSNGCYNNRYIFNGNTYSNSLIGGIKSLTMYGGVWNFSKNIRLYKGKAYNNVTYIEGNSELNAPGAPIIIRWADISFDTTFKTHNMNGTYNRRPSVASDSCTQYYDYKLDYRTTIFDGSAAIEISNNRYNLAHPTPAPMPCKKEWEQCGNGHEFCCKGFSCKGGFCSK